MIDIQFAAKKIIDGDLVAFPTETVYGIGADATNDIACKKIYEIKGRKSYNPLIIHIADKQDLYKNCYSNDLAEKIIDHFWPGPLSIILPKHPESVICNTATAGLDTIAIRMPAHPIALDLIKLAGKPIAAPSANISNYVSPTESSHVIEAFGDKITIIDGEKSLYGLESTIIDLTNDIPEILRYGFITPEAIENLIGTKIAISKNKKIIAPGMLQKHYSPQTTLRLNATKISSDELGLGFGKDDIGEFNLSYNGDLAEAAANLYSMLRLLDAKALRQNLAAIAVAKIPDIGIGLAINDRLRRGAV